MQKLFEKSRLENKNFFKDYLQHLFYEALAKERDNDNSFYSYFNCRIPFLNGGLFEAQYDWKNTNISIPVELFRNEEKNKSGDIGTGILDVFDRYNFTIKEDEPLDKEVAVDPEMLGKVFENMLEIKERKSKGAFYTPREIVHYMCQESLIHYLANALNDESKFVAEEEVEQYIREGHLALENDIRVAERGETKTYKFQLPESIRANADIIDKKLTEIRICDPAIGSGAFAIGLLHELVTAKLVLRTHLSKDYYKSKLLEFGFNKDEEVNESRYIYRLKRHIIQESIYGVDIDRSAIDIARLRLWLSLVVDEDDQEPIETLPNLDYKIVYGNSLIGIPASSMRDLNVEKELELLKDKFYRTTNEKTKKELRLKINSKINELLKSVNTFTKYNIDFDFKLFFSEVWRENKSFDVIIGNPPYISTKGIDAKIKKAFKDEYGFADDTYNHFFFKGDSLLTKNGIISYITPKTFWTTQTKRNLRDLILSNSIKYIFDTANPFKTAMVDTCITSYVKAKRNEDSIIKFLDGKKDLNSPEKYTLKQSVYLNTQNKVIFKPTELNLKIQKLYGKKIKDLYDVWWDKIKTSRDITKNQKKLETYRESLKPGDITLLGCITEGGQGLATANNGKYIAVRKSTKWANNIIKSRPKKLAKAIAEHNIKLENIELFKSEKEYLESLNEKEIVILFDKLKEQYGRDIFGQGYLFRIVEDYEIADVDALTDDEKENGIDTSKRFYVPYDKGDKDGNRWYLETPFVIAWSKENVRFLKTNSGKKGTGMPVVRNPQFYFREGFCWSDINTTFLKCRLKQKSINDVKSMSLYSLTCLTPAYYISSLINSTFISFYVDDFVNNTQTFQINDARQLPVLIPSEEQLAEFQILFNEAVKIKKRQFVNEDSFKSSKNELDILQKHLDIKIAKLYNLI